MTEKKVDKRAKFFGSAGLFLGAILAYLTFRWILFEPFVIPSGSMIPTLLINDHILVEKYAFGLRVPFTQNWLTQPQVPKRGEVVVFASVDEEDIYLIKRVIGLPGDHLKYTAEGVLLVNGQPVPTTPGELPTGTTANDLGAAPDKFQVLNEKLDDRSHLELLQNGELHYTLEEHVVPPGHIFMMGDNRDHSRDSRYWGDLPLENLVGRATWVWLSCAATLSQVNFLCDPRQIRWRQAVHRIQ